MSTYYKYEFWCTQENPDPANPGSYLGGYVTRITDDPAKPLICSNNKDHITRPDTLRDLDQIDDSSVTIQVETGGKTGGHYRCDCYAMDVAPGTTASQEIRFGFPVTILKPKLYTIDAQLGHVMSVSFPFQTIGVLTQDAAVGDLVLHVSPTAILNAMVGYDIRLTNGTTMSDYVGRVASFDTINSTITLTKAVAAAYPAGTYVQEARSFIDKVVLGGGGTYVFNDGNTVGAYLTTAAVGNFVYTNNSGSATVKAILHVEYLY
jgi:hypothetical protein